MCKYVNLGHSTSSALVKTFTSNGYAHVKVLFLMTGGIYGTAELAWFNGYALNPIIEGDHDGHWSISQSDGTYTVTMIRANCYMYAMNDLGYVDIV